MDKNLLDLFLEYTRGNPLWADFVNALDEFNQEQILAPIKELERIRHVDKDMDPVFVDKSVRQLGLAINNQLLEKNRGNIRKVFNMLPLYHELSGTPKFPRFIEFLLGRGFRATPLYTVDYVDFYAKPKGPLVIDGGQWYCTTHVELSVDRLGLEDILTLQIEQRDMKGLLDAGYDLAEINSLRGIDLDPNVHNRFITEHIIHNRIIELYYGFAPIEDVVEQVFLALPVVGDVFIAASTTIKAKEYIKLDAPGIKRLDNVAPNIVYGYQPYAFAMKVTMSDDTEHTGKTSFLRTEPEGYATGEVGRVVFRDVLEQTEIQVVVGYEGSEFYHTVQLIPSGVPAIPDEVFIKGKSRVMENVGGRFKLIGQFGDERYPVLDQDNVDWSIDSNDASFDGNLLRINEIYSEQQATVTAKYYDNDNNLHVKSMNVTLVDSVKELKPIDLTINVPNELLQGQSYPITVDALYSDGSTKRVKAHLKARSNKAKFNYEGSVYSPVVSRDYDTVFIAEFQDEGVALVKELPVTFIYPKLEVFKLTAIVPSTIKEHTRTALRCIAHWCKASDLPLLEANLRTEEQVQLFTSETDATWTHIGQHTFEAGEEGFEFDTLVTSVEHVDLDGSLFVAPEVDETRDMVLQARVTTESGRVVTTTKYLQIVPVEVRITSLTVALRQKLFEGESNAMSLVANWSDGSQTELEVGNQGHYNVSVSVLHEDKQAHPELYFDGNILRYDGVITGIATVTVTLQYQHDTLDGGIEVQEITETALVSVVPKIVLTDSIRTFAPESKVQTDGTWAMLNRSRMFIRTEAEFEDGTVEDIAPVITPVMLIPYEEQDVPLSAVTGEFSLRDMVSILTNKLPEEIYAELSMRYYGYYQVVFRQEDNTMGFIQTPESTTTTIVNVEDLEDFGIIRNHEVLAHYEEFQAIKTVADLNPMVVRTLIQASRTNEEAEIQLQFRYFKEELEQTVLIKEREVQPHNLILSKRITGPMEFYANAPAVSYALYVNFDDGGEEYGVSNDWELTILNKREVLVDLGMNFEIDDFDNKTDAQLDAIVPTNIIVDIDENGYVYPKENISALLRITAKFDDGKTQFTQELDVQMRRANTYLERLTIVGPSTVEDTNDPNFVVDGAMTHVPYKLLLWRVGSGVPEEVTGYWRLEQATDSKKELSGINVGEGDGKLYVKTQIENQDIFLVAYYEEQFDDRMEWVEKRKRIFINANKAVNQVGIDPVPAIVNDDGLLQLTATLTLEDGTQVPLSSAYTQEWIITESPEGVTISDTGQLSIPKLHTDSNVTVTVNVHSGSIAVESSVTFLVTAENALQALRIAGYQNVRDDSTVQLQAVLFRNSDVVNDFNSGDMDAGGFCDNRECVTDKCQWSIKRIDQTNIENVAINESSGLLSIGSVPKSFALEVTATYVEKDQPAVTHSLIMTIHSSLPRYGIGDWGIVDASDMNTLVKRVQNLKRGGSFNIKADPPQGQVKYGYFAHRKDVGRAVIKPINGATGSGNWIGANWPAIASEYQTETELQDIINQYGADPIEVEVTYDNVVDTWYLYRTERKNFGFGEFAYYYEVEQQ